MAKFNKRNQPVKCSNCGKLTAENSGIISDSPLCPACLALADLENEHLDGYHRDAPHADCKACHA